MFESRLIDAAERLRAGDLGAAEQTYREILETAPQHVGALTNLGLVHLRRGDREAAIAALREAVATGSPQAETHVGLARALMASVPARGGGPGTGSGGDLDEADGHFAKALALRPDLRAAHLGRLTLAARRGCIDTGAMARAAQAACPGDREIARAASQAFLAAGDADAAAAALRPMLAAAGSDARRLTELASAFMEAGAGADAVAALRRVVAAHPDSATARFNLAVALRRTNHLIEAIREFDAAEARGEPAESVAVERAACAVRLGQRDAAWEVFGPIVAEEGRVPGASTALMAALYDADRDGPAIRALHERATRSWPVAPERPAPAACAAEALLPVAFLSGDFKGGHPVAQFMLPLLKRLPAHGVAPTVWLTARDASPTARWLERIAPTRDVIGLDDAEAAEALSAEAPALLIDLAGHTNGNRLKLLGQMPAPVTASYLGYPGTTGFAGVDLLIADPVVVPPGHEALYTERIARLPNSFLCFDVPKGIPEPAPLSPEGRPLRFGSLNAYAKIGDATLALWARVLAAVPRSELFVKCGEFAEDETRAAFAARAASAGIAADRLVLEGPEAFVEAMAAYRRIDIALDTAPYNGGTTTCHALFHGTPVVTLAGDRFSARMGASVLRAAGRAEWVAADADGFVEIARALAADRAALHDIRCALPGEMRRSALGDIDCFAADFSALCRDLAGAPGYTSAPVTAPRRPEAQNEAPRMQDAAEGATPPQRRAERATPAAGRAAGSSAQSAAAPASGPTPENAFEISTSRLFEGFLADAQAALAITTYQAGMVLLIGTDPKTGKLWVFNRHVERPMGVACDRARLAVAGLTQIFTFVDGHHGTESAGQDPVYVPQMAHFTGDIDTHDLAFDGSGRPIFVNTLFSCIATVSETHSFRPLWQPPFIGRLAPEDRCHLNGFALRDGAPAFATAVARSDVADGWRERRRDGGIVMDVSSGEIVAAGLSMPHSPRWHGGKLWLLNAGTGEIGVVDPATGAFTPAAFCPGFLRGMAFLGRYAVVGLSEPRENRTFGDLPLQERLEREGAAPRCGLYVIDTETGDVVHWLRMHGVVTELFDIAVIPQARQPRMVGFRSDEIRRVVSIEPDG